MRYHNNGKPWLLAGRLWEAKRGLLVGAVISLMLLLSVLAAAKFVSFIAHSKSGAVPRLGVTASGGATTVVSKSSAYMGGQGTPGTFTHIQGAMGAISGVGTTVSLTLPAAPTPGNLVCVGIFAYVARGATSVTVKDSNNNVYTVTPHSPSSAQNTDAGAIYLAYLANAPANASATITATTAASFSDASIRAEEFHPSMSPAVFDADVAGSGSTGTLLNSPSITPAMAGELLYAAAVAQTNVASTNSPWTADVGGMDADGGSEGEYILSAAGGPTPVSYNANSSGAWDAMAMAFAAPARPMR